MKLLMFSTYRPFRAVNVFAAQLNTASESTNYMYCVNSVRWLDLTVASGTYKPRSDHTAHTGPYGEQFWKGVQTLRTHDSSDPRHFGTIRLVPKCPDISAPVPKCPRDSSALVSDILLLCYNRTMYFFYCVRPCIQKKGVIFIFF